MSGSVAATRPTRWPWIALASFIAIAVVGTVLVSANGESIGEQVPYIIAFSMFGVVGALIVSRDGRNTIGLMLLYGSLMTALSYLAGELVTWLVERGQTGWFIVVFGLLNNFGWAFGILPIVFLLPLLFPDGHLPSRRWRPFLWFTVAFLVLITAYLVLGQQMLTGSDESVGVANPFYVSAVGRLPSLDPVVGILFPLIFGGSVASLFLRFRRASGAERQQIKWVVFGLVVALVGIVSTGFSSDETILSAVIGGTAFLLFPATIGIAVMRFHLYELDVVVRKTLVYAILAVLATAVYLALVVGVGAWLGRGNSFLTMVAAVLVALTFQPVRARVTRFANRLVYGRRATPYEVLSEFSARVGTAYADEDILPRMARVLGEGVGAERSDVWLQVEQELRDVASWPDATDVRAPIPTANGAVPQIDEVDRVFAVEQAGELLGALAVRKPASEPLTTADEKLIADLAAQAGLVLRNVRLTEELKGRLDDLKAAQKRLVHAQDAGRRRLERNIHDGAQQQLVALAVKARLARQLADRDPAKAGDMLDQIEAETQTALEDLRDLARGIYPPLLADKGLPAALEAQLRKSALPAILDAEGVGRYPQEVEAAVYFSCLEALQNVAKYAEATEVAVEVRQDGAVLTFGVIDDGIGFDRDRAVYGTGLQGIADRLGALDGELELATGPGSGTELRGRIPALPELTPVDAAGPGTDGAAT